MSATIKVVHVCDHVVPEVEITQERNTFLTETSVCQISENPIHTIDRIEGGMPEPFLSTGNKTLVVNNSLKIDEFNYGAEGFQFSDSEMLFQNKALYNLSDKTRINGRIDGMCFNEGFTFLNKEFEASFLTQFYTEHCNLTIEELIPGKQKLVFVGNGTSPEFAIEKAVRFGGFSTGFLYMQLEVPSTCISLKVEFWSATFDILVFEETEFISSPTTHIKISKKVSLPEELDFININEALVVITTTFSSALIANGATVKMDFKPPITPFFLELKGTGYEHFEEKSLQYIFSDKEGRAREMSKLGFSQGRSIYIEALAAYSGQFFNSGVPTDEGYGWDVADPETGAPIYQNNQRVIIYYPQKLSPGATYEIRNNKGYDNVVYWVDAVKKCISISRGSIVIAPPYTVEAFIASGVGQNYADDLIYEMALLGGINDELDYEEVVPEGTLDMELIGIPNGKKQTIDISTMLLSRPVFRWTIEPWNIVGLDRSRFGYEIVTLSPIEDSVEFTTLAKEFKTFSWFAPEIDATDIDNIVIEEGRLRHYSCPIDQCIKLLVPKGSAVNLTDAALKFAGIQFVYEKNHPSDLHGYYFMLEGFEFTRIGQNAIKWDPSSLIANEIGTKLTAILETKKNINRKYDEYSCPRCSGNGWYVSTTADASKSIDYVTGVDKMVQDFLKILLTDIRYYKPGTAFITLKGFVKRDEKIKDLIVLYIKDAETQLRQLQYNMSIAGSEISKYEELKTVIIESIDTASSQDRIYIEIRLVNMASEYTTIGLAV